MSPTQTDPTGPCTSILKTCEGSRKHDPLSPLHSGHACVHRVYTLSNRIPSTHAAAVRQRPRMWLRYKRNKSNSILYIYIQNTCIKRMINPCDIKRFVSGTRWKMMGTSKRARGGRWFVNTLNTRLSPRHCVVSREQRTTYPTAKNKHLKCQVLTFVIIFTYTKQNPIDIVSEIIQTQRLKIIRLWKK